MSRTRGWGCLVAYLHIYAYINSTESRIGSRNGDYQARYQYCIRSHCNRDFSPLDKGVTPRAKKQTAKRNNKELEVTKYDNEGEGPPKKKAKVEAPEKTKHKRQQVAKEKEPNDTGQ